METRKVTAAVIAALLTIVLPTAALAQDQDSTTAGEQQVEFHAGDRLLSQKSKPGLLERYGCSDADVWEVFKLEANKGKIGLSCGGFDSSVPIPEPTTAGDISTFRYDQAVSCRNPVFEVRPNTVLMLPKCKKQLAGRIGELETKVENLKGEVASASGRAEAESKRADDNRAAAQAADVRANT